MKPANPQVALRALLLKQFEESVARNPRLSLRAFAKRSGVSASTLSLFFSGLRPVSGRLAERILTRLAIEADQREPLLELFARENRRPAPNAALQPQTSPIRLEVDDAGLQMLRSSLSTLPASDAGENARYRVVVRIDPLFI